VRQIPAERMLSDLTLLAPREVILPSGAAKDESLLRFLKTGLGASVTVYDDWIFERDEGARLLKESFKLVSEKSIPFADRPLAVSAAGAVLYYLRDHLHSQIGHVRVPVMLDTSEYLALERSTQRSLEIVTTQQGKKGAETLLGTVDQTLTSMGGRTLYQWITHPLLSAAEIGKRQDAVQELAAKADAMQALRELMRGVKDVERTLCRLNYGVANARDLLNLQLFLTRVPEIQKQLAGFFNVLLADVLKVLNPFPKLAELIGRSIVENPPLTLKEGGMIRDGYDAALDELKAISQKGKSWILEFQQREIERTGIKTLKVKYSQVFGYALEISKGSLHLVPPDYIRRQTLANAERFVVPELKEWDEKISGAQDKIKALEYEIFSRIRETILQELQPLQAMSRGIGVLDALASLAITALNKRWVRPTVVETGELMIEGGRHPVVEAMLPSGKFVENDAFLDSAENQLVVLTGPNMAGKSTYIRQIGLIVILAQIGSYVPAKSARIGLVDRIFTRIGASDDLASGESTFMVEMVETANILQKATSRSLLILDEVGRGTSTFDGVSIAWAICEYLVQGTHRPRTLFATHYHELTQLEDHFSSIKNYNITVRETKDDIIFLRKVVRGGSDRSYGIHVARLAGIPQVVTQRARKILDVLESENTEATQIIEGKRNKKKAETQQTLFEWSQQNHPVLEELRNMTVEGLTPLQALNKLAEWTDRLKPDSKGGA
jgi:DNA mismatch repair protein MutS